MKLMKKIITILMIIINVFAISNISIASSYIPDKVEMFIAENHEVNIKFRVDDLKIPVVKYRNNGKEYYAYGDMPGIKGIEEGTYSQEIKKQLDKENIWKTILAGFPYKTYQELGCSDEYEAYAATQIAVYTALDSLKVYTAKDGNALGKKILQVADKILEDAKLVQLKEEKIGEVVTDFSEWEEDEIDKNYISKKHKVLEDASSETKTYKVSIESNSNDLPNGIKIVDENNQEKDTFSSNEIFKVMIPMENAKSVGEYKINVQTKIETDKIYYCIPSYGLYRKNYYLLTDSVDELINSLIVQYPENETKIVIENQNSETKEKLKDFQFEVLNENYETVYSDLKTNEQGIVEVKNVLPGRYYIKEVSVTDEYVLNEELIPIDVYFNDTITAIFNNKKGEKPATQVERTSKILKTKQAQSTKNGTNMKKLPITGM